MTIKESSARLCYLLRICVDFNVQYRHICKIFSFSNLSNYFRHCETIHQHYDSRVKTLIGQDHPAIWKLIDKLRKKDMEERALERSLVQGNAVRKRVRVQTRRLQNRLLSLCQMYIEIITSSWMIFSKP